MNEYEIINTNTERYDKFVICLTSESLLNYIKDIECSLSGTESDVTMLVDQLLITGNGDNRFMSCLFKNGKLDFKTAHTIIPTEYYREKTVEFLHDNYCYVENYILTEVQRQKIKNKIVF